MEELEVRFRNEKFKPGMTYADIIFGMFEMGAGQYSYEEISNYIRSQYLQ